MKAISDYPYYVTPAGEIYREGGTFPLKPSLNPQNGYLYVSLWKNNIGKTFSVHRLVAQAYLENPDGKPEVNHINSNRADPRSCNLEWCTASENITHAYQYGNKVPTPRKLSDFELELALNAFLSGVSMTAIADSKQVGLTRFTINLRDHAALTTREGAFQQELLRQQAVRNKQANVSKQQRVTQLTKDGDFIAEYPSLTAAAKAVGASSSGNISNVLKGRTMTCMGYRWIYS